MLGEFAEQTMLPRSLRAGLFGVSEHVLRRWEDCSRRPSRPACRLIALVCGALSNVGWLEASDLLFENIQSVFQHPSGSEDDQIGAINLTPKVFKFHLKILAELTSKKTPTHGVLRKATLGAGDC